MEVFNNILDWELLAIHDCLCLGIKEAEKNNSFIKNNYSKEELIQLRDRFSLEISSRQKPTLIAKCTMNRNPINNRVYDLEEGKEYPVSRVDMGSSFTWISLEGKEGSYNSVCFDFYENGKMINIYKDKRYNPYLR